MESKKRNGSFIIVGFGAESIERSGSITGGDPESFVSIPKVHTSPYVYSRRNIMSNRNTLLSRAPKDILESTETRSIHWNSASCVLVDRSTGKVTRWIQVYPINCDVDDEFKDEEIVRLTSERTSRVSLFRSPNFRINIYIVLHIQLDVKHTCHHRFIYSSLLYYDFY